MHAARSTSRSNGLVKADPDQRLDLLESFDRDTGQIYGADPDHARQPRTPGHGYEPMLHRTRSPLIGLPLLAVLCVAGAFFGWVSADPFWLATGAGHQGTATVQSCSSQWPRTCTGNFQTDDHTAERVDLSGVPPSERRPGARQPARMLDRDHAWAYSGPVWTLHLRWGLGLLAALLCALGAVAVSGARFLRPLGRGRVAVARALAFAGPLLSYAVLIAAARL